MATQHSNTDQYRLENLMARSENRSGIYSKSRLHWWHWFIAVLLVGQVFQHFLYERLGGVSRNYPLSSPLLVLYGLVALVIIRHVLLAGGFRVCLGRHGILMAAIWLLFGAVLILSLIHTPAPQYGFIKTSGYFAFNVGPSLLILLLIKNEREMIGLMKTVTIVGLLSTVIVVLATFSLAGSIGGIGDVWQRKAYFYIFNTKVDLGIWLGRRMSVLMVTSMVLIHLLNSKTYRYAAYFLTILFAYLLFLAAARGPLFFGLLIAAVIGYLLSHSVRMRALSFLCIIAIASLIFAKFILEKPFSIDAPYLFAPREVLENYNAPVEDPAGSYAIRLELFRSAFETFVKNPIIGVGIGGWAYEYSMVDYRDYPHNIFLEVASELGIMGLAVFSLFIVLAYRYGEIGIKMKGKSHQVYLLTVWGVGITLIGFFNAQVSGDICGNEYLWIGAAILCKLATWVDVRKNFNKMMAFNRIVDSGQDFHQSKLTENLTHR